MPFHHQYLLAQLVKGIVIKGGEEKYKNYNFYNFSGLKGQTKISRNGLHYYSTRVTLVFSCPDQNFVDYFLKNLFEFPQIEVGNLVLIPEGVEREEYPEIGDSMKFICISPVVLLKPTFNDVEGKRFVSPESDMFSDLLYETTMIRIEKYGAYSSEEISSFYKFQIVPDKDYLNKIRESQKKFARIYPVYDQDVKYEVRGYTFPFTLYAAKEVQEFVFTCGLGSYSHKGFGMLDIANSDPSKRAIKYDFNVMADDTIIS